MFKFKQEKFKDSGSNAVIEWFLEAAYNEYIPIFAPISTNFELGLKVSIQLGISGSVLNKLKPLDMVDPPKFLIVKIFLLCRSLMFSIKKFIKILGKNIFIFFGKSLKKIKKKNYFFWKIFFNKFNNFFFNHYLCK